MITANGSVDTTEEVTFFLKEMDMFVPVQLLEDTPVVLSLGKLFEENGIHTSGTKVKTPILSKITTCTLQMRQFRAHRRPWFITTPRPAQKIVLQSARQSQQQQQQEDTSESASSGTRKLVQREEQGNPTDNPELLSVRNLKRSAESLLEKEEPEFKVDLRIEGVAQDGILKDQERMGKIQEAVERLRRGSRTKSILEDLGKPESSMKLSEESSRIFHEMGNIELYVLDRYPEPSSAIHA